MTIRAGHSPGVEETFPNLEEYEEYVGPQEELRKCS